MTNEDIEGSLGSFSVTGGHILDNSKELRERSDTSRSQTLHWISCSRPS
jgi:hypothetical protein